MNRIVVLFMTAFICSGCSSTTTSQLRERAAHHSNFEVDDGLQKTIKK